MATDWSSRVMKLMPPAPSVMGTPIFSSWPSTSRREGGVSLPMQEGSHRRARTSSASSEPAVTPAMAPAAPISGETPRTVRRYHVRPSPTTSFPADSTT